MVPLAGQIICVEAAQAAKIRDVALLHVYHLYVSLPRWSNLPHSKHLYANPLSDAIWKQKQKCIRVSFSVMDMCVHSSIRRMLFTLPYTLTTHAGGLSPLYFWSLSWCTSLVVPKSVDLNLKIKWVVLEWSHKVPQCQGQASDISRVCWSLKDNKHNPQPHKGSDKPSCHNDLSVSPLIYQYSFGLQHSVH